MSSVNLTGPLSVRAFLLGDAAGADTVEVLARALSEQDAPQSAIEGLRGLSASGLQAVNREIATVAGGLLNLGLGDILMAGWCKYTELTKAAERTLASPGSEEVVVLAKHSVVSTHRPSIDLIVNGAKAHTFVFELTVVFDLNGVAAVLRQGDLVALHGGECVITATLTLKGTPLRLTRKCDTDPAVVVHLRRPIPLARQGNQPTMTRLDRPAPLGQPYPAPADEPAKSHPPGHAP